ncbi:MAG: hypothetical protein C0467_16235 [Planctomycetaceae bacterium]|nr:hypothetical protein [Planctomycetaceae bacterium]
MVATPSSSFTLITMMLPGPDRKRIPSPYHFRVTYRNPNPGETGCIVTWEVRGGREQYQISLERTDDDALVWHCTCPDAVYHADYRHACGCKHVQGIKQVFESIGNPVGRLSARAVA